MSHEKKHPHHFKKLHGTFRHLIFSPKGGIEGLLMEIDGEPNQLVVDPEHGDQNWLAALKSGQNIGVEAEAAKPSPKGQRVHAVYQLHQLIEIDGRKPKARAGEDGNSVSGKVIRYNFAKHGEPNGVILDNGDFIHLKPKGLAASGLKVGDKVTAAGDMRRLIVGEGRVVEAREVNGHAVK